MDVYLYGFLVFDFTPPEHEPAKLLGLHRLGVTTSPIAANFWHSSPCFSLPE
jgi:hypothetical protein